MVLGLVFIVAPNAFGHGNDQPPEFLGWLFLVLGSFLILFGWTFAVLTLLARRCISRRKHYTFCFVVACSECLSVPFGTVLRIVTILVLNRASVNVGEGVVCTWGPQALNCLKPEPECLLKWLRHERQRMDGSNHCSTDVTVDFLGWEMSDRA